MQTLFQILSLLFRLAILLIALLFRPLVVLLFALVPILGVWTFVKAPDWGLWFPSDVSTHGAEIDALFYLILVMVAVTFLLTEGYLVWCAWRYTGRRHGKSLFTHGNHKLELVWTAIPAILLLVIAFAQMGAWADIKFESNFPESEYSVDRPIAHVYASQFDWRVYYPDEQGSFDGPFAVQRPFEFVVPVDTPIVFHLRSRDVLHSFFLPNLRLKQDAVPGMSIPVWFEATEEGVYDLICAELCGWGHYKMAGELRVLSQDDYRAWLEAERAALLETGA